MLKTIKKVILSCLSVLSLSVLFWVILSLNPSLSYANQTQFDFVTVYHDQALEQETELVINSAINIIKKSALFKEETLIELCINDNKVYPNLHPFYGQPLGYAMLDKTVLKNCKVSFKNNVAETQWAINNHELRKFDLTWLLAHEFTHNLQNRTDFSYVFKSTLGHINWKLEGHAEYIARAFKQDGALKNKIAFFLVEDSKEKAALPVFELADGTKQIFSYYKYALIVQYLMEEKGLNYKELCELEVDMEDVYKEMIEWSGQ